MGGGGHLHVWDDALGEDTQVIAVDMMRLDDLDVPSPRLIRIDAEGSEAQVLRGAERMLERPDVVICMEWDIVQLSSRGEPSELSGWLKEKGFRFWRITRDGELVEVRQEAMTQLAPTDLLVARTRP